MTIHEFWTFVTDLLIAALSFYYSWKLRKLNLTHKSAQLWQWIFIFIGLAALMGAIYHGLIEYLSPAIHHALRVSTLWSLNFTALLLSFSVLIFSTSKKSALYKFFVPLILIKFIIFLSLSLIQHKFIIAISDYGSAFVIALFIFVYRSREPASKGMALGIVVSFIAAAIQILKIAPSQQFNHNDLYHVVQVIGLYIFYKSVPLLRDSESQ